MRRLGRRAWTVVGILIALSIVRFIYISYFREHKIVNGIYVSGLLLAVSEYEHIDYCKLLKKAIKKDSTSIRIFTLLEIYDAASYDHGEVIVDLIGIIGEDNFLQALATINNREKAWVEGSIEVGLEYGDNPKYKGKRLKEAFPKIYKFLDYDRGGVIEGNDSKSDRDSVRYIQNN